ncbi:unnamed protein product [Brassica oleracea]
MEGAEEAGAEIMVDSKDLQKQSKALDKLTDRVEDRQLDSSHLSPYHLLYLIEIDKLVELQYTGRRNWLLLRSTPLMLSSLSTNSS